MTKIPTETTVEPSMKAEPEVRPLDGWNVQTRFGTLQTYGAEKLVRLEDVHAWMYGKGTPPKNAVFEIFSPFYRACIDADDGGGTEALTLPGRLYALNAQSYPNALFIDEKRSRNESVRFLVGAFPELGHVQFPDGSIGALVYSMAEGALRVWHGHADISTDHLETVKRRQERKTDETYAIHWPSDEALRNLLGRLAVPIRTAHELWGWGELVKSAEVLHLHAVPLAGAGPTTWAALVKFRIEYPQTEWTPEQKAIAAVEAKRRKAAPGAMGVAVAMAKELGVTVSRFNDLIRKVNEAGKRALIRGKVA